jgi:hypothetical protein
MNLVYHNSILTIIASAGSDSHYGLPGISRRREGSPQVKIGACTFSSVPFSITGELETSPWSTRAWTYQEGILSTRRLVFTDKQVYYECQGCYWFEGIDATPNILETLHLPTKQGFHHSLYNKDVSQNRTRPSRLGAFPADRTGSHGREIKSRIEEYSKRSLTHEGDIVNAMLGLFDLYDKQYGVHHIWGVPYPRNDLTKPKAGSGFSLKRIDFLNTLGWTLKSHSSRRHSFPSWSWTGWHGAVKWQPEVDQGIDSEHWCQAAYVVEDTKFSIKLEKSDRSLIDWVYTEHSQSSATTSHFNEQFGSNELSTFLHVAAKTSRILPGTISPTENTFFLEPETTDGRSRWVRLDLDLHACSPSVDPLYALRMPWQSATWMLVIKDCGAHWERVGVASYDEYRNNSGYDKRVVSTKTARMQIKLG